MDKGDLHWRTHRAAYHAAALATLGSSPEWDSALREYMKRRVLANADMEFGASYRSEEKRLRIRWSLEAKFGKSWRTDPRAEAESLSLDTFTEADDAATFDDFTRPLFRAAHSLALTPAPTFEAACFKQLMMETEAVYCDGDMPRDCMEIVEEDFTRLAGVL